MKVHSFQTLPGDLATIVLNGIQPRDITYLHMTKELRDREDRGRPSPRAG